MKFNNEGPYIKQFTFEGEECFRININVNTWATITYREPYWRVRAIIDSSKPENQKFPYSDINTKKAITDIIPERLRAIHDQLNDGRELTQTIPSPVDIGTYRVQSHEVKTVHDVIELVSTIYDEDYSDNEQNEIIASLLRLRK